MCSAPGKVIISGEHSVVYGKHALVTAINLRCYSQVNKADRIKIISELGETGLNFEVHPYVSWAIKLFEERIKRKITPEVRIKSQIPIASGLGSSAAVTVSTLAALSLEYGMDFGRDEIFEIAREVELRVQGRASGVDPFVSTFGGAWLMPEREKFSFNARLLIVDSGESSITSEMVAKVAMLKERYPEIVDGILDVMDRITIEIKKALETGNDTAVASLFSINQCMLKAIGVSTRKIDRIISMLERSGIAAKITGAGGGGSILGFVPRRIKELELEHEWLEVSPEYEGVRCEHGG
jgi:mevalonate kinase